MKINREWTYSLDEIENIVNEFLEIFNDFKIICLDGVLGSGKTTLVKTFSKVIGSNDDVTSPTFSLINQYKSNAGEIFHFDLYRLNTREEVLDIGFEELIHTGNYCFIEWYKKIKDLLPPQEVVYCEIKIINASKRRLIAITE